MLTDKYYNWLMFFYIYSFLGWCFESIYVSIRERKPINRGFLRSPFLPLYGNGACLMLFAAMPNRENYILTYLIGTIGATLLELFTGLSMEHIFKVKYWDYSFKRYNYKGVICLSSSLFWGGLTIFMTHIIHPAVKEAVYNMQFYTKQILLLVLTTIFATDFILSTRAALDFAKALSALDKVKSEVSDIQLRILALRESVKDSAANKIHSAGEQIGLVADSMLNFGNTSSEHISAVKERLHTILSKLKNEVEIKLRQNSVEPRISTEYKKLLGLINSLRKKLPSSNRIITFFRRGMLKGNPDATSPYSDAFLELKENEIIAKKQAKIHKENLKKKRRRP